MIQCSKCQNFKDKSEFYIKNKKRLQSYCKNCFNKYTADRWKFRRIEALAYKGNKCCDCLIKYDGTNSCIFDFHHLNPEQKEFEWTKMRQINKNKLLLELDKTVLLCSNCHRLRHYKL